MLSTCACSHRSPTVGMLKKRPYLFVLVSGIVVCLFCYLKDSESASNTTWSLEGEVTEVRTHARLGGVRVQITGLERSVRTDANGQFKFDAVPEGQQTLQFLKVGYRQFEQRVDVNASTPYLQIALEALPFQLETIRVYGSNRSLSQFEETTDLALGEAELQRRLGMTLANTLADEMGISQRMMGRGDCASRYSGIGRGQAAHP